MLNIVVIRQYISSSKLYQSIHFLWTRSTN